MLDLALRLYVVLAGLAWALSGCVMFIVALGRLEPLSTSLLSLLSSVAFAGALWLSGFGACRGRFRWLLVAALVPFIARALLAPVVIFDLPLGAAATVLVLVSAGVLLPAGFALFLLFNRPPWLLLALERLASRPSSSAPAA